MGISDIRKEVKKFDKTKIIDLIADLYKKNKSVKEYFDFFINPDENERSKNTGTKFLKVFIQNVGMN